MGCGCQKAGTGSIRNATLDEERAQSLTPVYGKLVSDISNSMSHAIVRFTRKSEFVDYFERDPVRPSRNEEMNRAFKLSSATFPAVEEWTCPKDALPIETKQPQSTLQLEYVYGYQCCASSKNLFYSKEADTVIYPCGAIIVLLNKISNSQTFLGAGTLEEAEGHSDSILSLTINTTRTLLASGEVGQNPLICIWKETDRWRLETTIEQGEDTRGVGKLAFSRDSRYLLAVDIAFQQKLRIYDLKQDAELIYSEYPSKNQVLACSWSPNSSSFCTVDPVYFWSKTAHGFHRESGMFTAVAETTQMSTVDWFSNGNCLTGGLNGKLYLWSGHKTLKSVQILSKGAEIHALAIVNNVVVTGGQDSVVHVLDLTLKEIRKIDAPNCLKSLDWNDDTVLCGTKNGMIQEFKISSRNVLMEAHSEGELWSMALDPADPHMLISTGDDNKIKCWDLSQRRCMSTGILEASLFPSDLMHQSTQPKIHQSRALCISEKGHVAVGHNDGHVTIRMNVHQLNNILTVLTDAEDWIQVMRYSPASTYLAVGSHDRYVYIYNVPANYKLFFKLGGHLGPVTSIDWSLQETYLKTCTLQGELLFWEVQTETQIPEGDERVVNETWATWTSAVGWPVRGINQLTEDPEFVTCVSRSRDNTRILVGNIWGLLELYYYPNAPGSKPNRYRAHSLEVANVIWTEKDGLVLTVGGHDLTIMQWRVKNET